MEFIKSRQFATLQVLLMMLVTVSGCREDRTIESYELESDEIVVSPSGGTAEIICRGMSAESDVRILSERSWIHDFDHSVQDKILFTVDPNDGDADRSGTVEVTVNATGEKLYFTVLQYADTREDFEVTIQDVAETSMTFSIVPKDPEMTYVYMFTEKSYWDMFSSDEEWYEDDMAYFRDMATSMGLSISQYLGEILKKGTIESGYVENLLPGTGYVLYAYGLTQQGNRLTDICLDSAVTKSGEKVDMEFELFLDIDGPVVDMRVVPSNDSQAYYFGAFDATDIGSDEDIIRKCEQNFNDIIVFYRNQFGMSAEDVMRQIVSYGEDSYKFELEQNSRYVAFAVAVDLRGLCVSDPASTEFETGEVIPSDNHISVEISGVTSRTADYSITVTNDDPYVFVLDLASEWEGLSEDEMIQRLVTMYDLSSNIRTGNDHDVMTGLTPDTEYVTFAFGYVAGVATTDLVCTWFATKEATVADVSVDFAFDGYFDGTEVENAWPEYFGGASGNAVIRLDVSSDGATFYYNIFAGDLSSETDITDSQLVDELLYQGIQDEPVSWFVIPFDETSTIIGVARDASGEFGPVTRIAITPDRNNVLPIEELNLNSMNHNNIKIKSYEKIIYNFERRGNGGNGVWLSSGTDINRNQCLSGEFGIARR